MRPLALSLAAYPAAAVFNLSPLEHARSQPPMAAVPAIAEGEPTESVNP